MLLALYIVTLLFPMVSSFFLDDMDSDDSFFSVFSINKVLFFANGMLLAEMTGYNPAVGILIGFFQAGCYYFGFKLIKGLEYKSHKTIVLPGAVGKAYTNVIYSSGKVIISGEIYEARSAVGISAFTLIKVVGKVDNSNILIVEELQGEE